MSDATLRQTVLDELDYDPQINAAHIGVAVENGVVTLSGHVGSYAEKLAAEKAARRVRGVRAIAEELRVRFLGDPKTADDEIAARAVAILRWSVAAPADHVSVKVQHGHVQLSGEVDWQYQRHAAENAVRQLSGVAGIVNAITVRPRPLTSDVKRKIDAALRRNAEIDARNIHVSVDGGLVSLNGHVHGWRERDAAESAAWSAPGVARVKDNLRIV